MNSRPIFEVPSAVSTSVALIAVIVSHGGRFHSVSSKGLLLVLSDVAQRCSCRINRPQVSRRP